MPELTIRGLPSALANDAWWFASTTEQPDAPKPTEHERRGFAPLVIAALIALIALADFLFWQRPVGISLVFYSAGLTAAALANLRPRFSPREWVALACIWLLSALPVIEYLQELSVLFLILGHAGLLVWCATRARAGPLTRAVLLSPVTLVWFAASRCINAGTGLVQGRSTVTPASLTAWVLPLSAGFVFLLLFILANPVFEQWLNDLGRLDIDTDTLDRVAFWTIAGFLALPFAMFNALAPHLQPKTRTGVPTVKRAGALINARSVTNSLILFNAMFLLQNATDLAILWAGAQLPEGMSYATYTHRGAYPLMATSILAGLFALVSRRFTFGSDLIRLLLVLWVAQNVVLLASAIMRLDLYVEAYGMTYLRIHAGIGMMLVLVGMILLIWQLWRAKSNLWLTGSFTCVTVAVLYVASLTNLGNIIATINLSRIDHPLDEYYLCRHTPSGIKAMQDYTAETGLKLCIYDIAHWQFLSDDWRGWSFRDARLDVQLKAYQKAPGVMRPIPNIIEDAGPAPQPNRAR